MPDAKDSKPADKTSITSDIDFSSMVTFSLYLKKFLSRQKRSNNLYNECLPSGRINLGIREFDAPSKIGAKKQ
jgi:hypothetical protein